MRFQLLHYIILYSIYTLKRLTSASPKGARQRQVGRGSACFFAFPMRVALTPSVTVCSAGALFLLAMIYFHIHSLRAAILNNVGGGGRIRSRDEDCSSVYPSPYVLGAPPHPKRDPSWNELVTVVSSPEQGAKAVGQLSTWRVHTQGLWHRAAYVVVKVGGDMLIQQRSDFKWTYPRLWEYSASETMEGDESFEVAATRAVNEEMMDLLKEGLAFPSLRKCCAFTYVWEGPMPFMYLKDWTVAEVYHADINDVHLNKATLSLIDRRMHAKNSASPIEVGGWQLMPIETLREEAKSLSTKKYAPWLLAALDNTQCRACWH